MEKLKDIALWFLSKEPMTLKKLEYLAYYAQKHHYRRYKVPLFNEEIQAWIHGPGIPALYDLFGYQWYEVIPQVEFDEMRFDDMTLNTLYAVFDTCAPWSEELLEGFAHRDDLWLLARGNLKPWETSCDPITFDDLETQVQSDELIPQWYAEPKGGIYEGQEDF